MYLPSQLAQALAGVLKQGLPGESAHALLAPSVRKELLKIRVEEGLGPPKEGAVLLLLHQGPEARDPWQICLTLRPEYPGVHSAQISFAGGKIEKGESVTEAAIREGQEELSLDPDQVEAVGALSPLYIPPSHFRVHPVLAVLQGKARFIPDPREVAQIFQVPVWEALQWPVRLGEFANNMSQGFQAPYYPLQEHKIWGATAMILAEGLQIFRKLKGWEARPE